jgi:hypothetical protein
VVESVLVQALCRDDVIELDGEHRELLASSTDAEVVEDKAVLPGLHEELNDGLSDRAGDGAHSNSSASRTSQAIWGNSMISVGMLPTMIIQLNWRGRGGVGEISPMSSDLYPGFRKLGTYIIGFVLVFLPPASFSST